MNSDSELVERVLTGETDSFRTLVERYQDAVYGVLLSKTGSFSDAQDLAQEAFLAAFESLSKLKDPARFGTWLYGIALNKAKAHLRRQSLRRRSSDRLEASQRFAAATDEIAATREAQAAVMSALQRLSEPNRETAALYYINGYSQKDISRFTNRPLGTIKRRLHDARRQLRKELVAMVEAQLKRSRPKREFTNRVLRKITQVRVRLTAREADFLFLTDSKRRSFPVFIGNFEAQAIQPWLTGSSPEDASDIHSALVHTLDHFGRRLERVIIGNLIAGTFLATIQVKSRGRVAAVDSRPSDAINFAVRAGAPIFAKEDVLEQCYIKRKDGKPMAPSAAWRRFHPRLIPLRPISKVLAALERNPEDAKTRRQLFNSTSHFTQNAPWIVPHGSAIREMKSWVERRKGSKLEGVANGLLGAVYVWTQQPDKAIPYLEKAHESCPKDGRITFDLATAYTMTGMTDSALSAIQKLDNERLKVARNCGNFASLWRRRSFRSTVGAPDRQDKHMLISAQIGVGAKLGGEFPVPAKTLLAASKAKPSSSRRTIKMGRISQSRKRQLEELLRSGALLTVESATRPWRKKKTEHWFVLEVFQKAAAAIRLRKLEPHVITGAFNQPHFPRPLTAKTVCSALDAAGIRLEAVALLKRTRSGIEAALVASDDGKQAAIPIDAVAGISIAIVSKSPILITETLAEKLYVRGKSGRPLSVKSATKKLLAT